MVTSPFTEFAGQTMIPGAPKDRHGNAQGTQYDLAKDDGFSGEIIVILNLVPEECTIMSAEGGKTQAALEQKGFKVVGWSCTRGTNIPSPEELRTTLKQACQFWLISTKTVCLSSEHYRIISEFYDSGKGLFVWGDNDPYYQDANLLFKMILNISMEGNSPGGKIVHERNDSERLGSGFLQHEITTGLEHLFEGVTVATIKDYDESLQPLIWGSAGNLITAYYDQNGKRFLVDSAFTRLYMNWDDAGTARFVKNAASWLTNWKQPEPALSQKPQPKKPGGIPWRTS